MKKSRIFKFLAVAAAIAIVLAGCSSRSNNSTTPSAPSNDTAQSDTEDKDDSSKPASDDAKTLIVYYSYSGTTERVAEHLRDLTDGTLYELELAEPYTGSDNDVSDRVFAERDDGKMPELTGTLPDVSEYDRILIGTPVWNNSMANPVLGYLQQTDFDGKVVAPFWTYITNQGTTGKDFTANIQNGTAADGLALRSANGMDDEKLDSTLQDWLDKLPSTDS